MEAKQGGFYQTANSRTERFAVVIGSGDKGQTYLFSDGDQLFQLSRFLLDSISAR